MTPSLTALWGCDSAPPAHAVASVAIGAQAPDSTLPWTDGNAISLSSLKGQPVVLEWFAPMGPPVKPARTQPWACSVEY